METAATPSTVMDYVEAIQRVGSGQFTSKFREDGQKFLASFFGAPFFALSRLAPEAIDDADSQLLLIAADSMLGSDAGRWLSLYARVHRATGKFNLSVCVPSKPRSFKPPKPLLFQPMQSVVVKDWARYLETLGSPPDVLLFYPRSFEDLDLAAQQLPRNASGSKLLVSCGTQLAGMLAKRLLQSYGYDASDILGFGKFDDEPQQHAIGAWWFSTGVPAQSALSSPDPDVIEGLRAAHQRLEAFLLAAKSEAEREASAAVIGMRTTETVGDKSIRAVRTSGTGGIDLDTGRAFTSLDSDAEAGFFWDDFTLPPDLLEQAPRNDGTPPADVDRIAVMIWLGQALAECAKRELQKISEDDSANQITTLEPENNANDSAPGTAQAQEALPSEHNDEASGQTEALASEAKPAASTPPPPRPRLSRSAGTVNVLALAARLGRIGEQSTGYFDKARNKLLAWLGNKGFGDLDATSNQHCEHPDGELTIETDGESIWSMRFDDRGAMESGAIWRVEATLLRQPFPAISLRLLQVRSSEDAPAPIASGVPHVVATIAKDVGLQDAGVSLQNTALRFKGETDAPRLSRLLLNPHRAQPVIVISGSIDASADRLAKRLAGVAHVAVIDSVVSNHLIRIFGRDLSVYGTAVRLYRPGFDPGADQYQHRVWPRKGTQLSKWQANDIFEEACAISVDADDLEDRAPSFQTVRSHLTAARLATSEQRLAALRERAEGIASSKDEQINRLQAVREELETALAEYKSKTGDLESRQKDLQAELQAVRIERDSALEEARQLRYQISNQWVEEAASEGEESEAGYYPDTWDELEDWVEVYGEGRLVLHSKAAKAARASPFKDIPLAYKAMEYLVRYYIPMRTRSEDDTEAYQSSVQALAELGLEESDVGTADEIRRYKKEYERLYDGKTVTLDRHLKRGIGFGGEHQFRLYFYYDQEQAKVLVGHFPTHLTNRLSHNG